MIAVLPGSTYLVITDCQTVNYGQQSFCLINSNGFMIAGQYDRNLSHMSNRYSINKLYNSNVSGNTYRMEYNEEDLLWTRKPKNLNELIISRRFLQ